jgi:hypothetical protein
MPLEQGNQRSSKLSATAYKMIDTKKNILHKNGCSSKSFGSPNQCDGKKKA